jgi:hypothetical protein
MTVLSPARGIGLPSVRWGWDSGVGGHGVLSLYARVSDHVSGRRCSSLTTDI